MIFENIYMFVLVGKAAASDDTWAVVSGERTAAGTHAVTGGQDVPFHLRGLPRGPHRQTHCSQGCPKLHVHAAQVCGQLKISPHIRSR